MNNLLSRELRDRVRYWRFVLNDRRYPVRPIWAVYALLWVTLAFLLWSFGLGSTAVLVWTVILISAVFGPQNTRRLTKDLLYRWRLRKERRPTDQVKVRIYSDRRR